MASKRDLVEKMEIALKDKENVETAIYENLDDVVKANISKLAAEVAAASASNESSKQQLLKFPKPSDELVAAHKEVNACFLEILGSAIGVVGKSRDLQEGLIKIWEVEEKEKFLFGLVKEHTQEQSVDDKKAWEQIWKHVLPRDLKHPAIGIDETVFKRFSEQWIGADAYVLLSQAMSL